MMKTLAVGIWANYAFGSSSVSEGDITSEFQLQGFEIGIEANYAYQIKPYKTYILIGIFGFYENLNMFPEKDGWNYGDVKAENLGLGLNVGVRFDFGF